MPFAASPAAAQTIRVRTVDEVTRQPAAGALVSLLAPSGARLRQRLTDHLGRATLTASGPGVYRVRADRIGHPGITSDSLALRAADTVELTIAMPGRRTLLLSDFFLRTHCFRTEWSRRDGRAVVALQFEPLRGPTADISGALWLDPSRAELTSVDWRYERLPRDVPSGATGTARFEAPLEGGYVVWHWAIRMPHQLTVTVQASDGTPDLGSHPVIEGYVEEGGEVLRIESRPPAPATQRSSRPAAYYVLQIVATARQL